MATSTPSVSSTESTGASCTASALRVLGQRELAEEATQQAFVQAWRGAASFEGARPMGPWLATIARRVAIDIHRREARRATTDIDEVPHRHGALITLPPSADTIHDVWAVRQAVDGLPADEQEVVRLQHLEGFTHSEIADHLGVPIGTVKSRAFRARPAARRPDWGTCVGSSMNRLRVTDVHPT